MAATNELFLTDMRNSLGPVLLVARHLSRKGLDIRIPGQHIRPSYEEKEEYIDKGDLFICGPPEEMIQVKGRGVSFTKDPATFRPHDKDSTIFIDEAYKIDRLAGMGIRARYYVMVSANMRFFACIDMQKCGELGTRTVWSERDRREETCYVIDKWHDAIKWGILK